MVATKNFFKNILKATKIYEKLSIKNFFAKKSVFYKNSINNISLNDAIFEHIYRPPTGLLLAFKAKIVFINLVTKKFSKKYKKAETAQNTVPTIKELNTAYLEYVSLHISNNTLKKILKEKTPLAPIFKAIID